MGTAIRLTKLFEKQLNKVPAYVRDRALAWIEAVELYGIYQAQKTRNFRDEALKGKRKGQRSIRLSKSYRLIYKTTCKNAELEVLVLEVNNHDY